jgi:hypothetical protein
VAAQHLRVVVDLHRQLARGREDHAAARTRPRRAAWRSRRLERGDQECGGLAGAGLRLAGDVAARQRQRQRLRLDRRAGLEAGTAYAFKDGLGQPEF